MTRSRIIAFALSILLFTQGCLLARTRTTNTDVPTMQATATVNNVTPTITFTPPPTPTLVSSVTEIPPTPTASVRVTAIDGNLYIRRGPGTPYNRIGLLSKGESAEVIGKDMLSKWVQVNIPGSDATGWVSLLTPFSQVDGDLSGVPAFTFTEWPEPAYIKNCTEHDLLVLPNELYLYNLYNNNNYLNEVQVDPGVYNIQDLFVPGEPVFQKVDVREGETIYITVNALGETHNCP